MSNLLTNSRFRCRRECHRKHHIQYVEGWRPVRASEAMFFGTLAHTGLEAWWKAGADRLGAALEAVQNGAWDAYQQAAVEELLAGYELRWGHLMDEGRFEVIAIEETFTVPMINPATGGVSRTWAFAGKVDGIIRDCQTGALFLLEHKTTGDTICDPAALYWQKLAMDYQVSHYFIGAEALGHEVAGCLYDVLLRPQLRPYKATPEEKRKYKKDGALYGNQRAEDETPDAYRIRVREDIEDKPEKYFQRRDVFRTDSDIQDYLFDAWAEGRSMREAELAGRAPRNPEACHRFGTCSFWDICANGLKPEDDPDRFERVEDVHPELNLKESAS